MSRVNSDYISGVYQTENGMFEIFRSPIAHTSCMRELKEMLNDDDASIFDMQDLFKQHYHFQRKVFDFCYPCNYNDTYGGDASYPVFIDIDEYKALVKQIREKCAKSKSTNSAREAIKEKKDELKNTFYRKCDKYSHAVDYHKLLDTLVDNDSIRVWSRENRGWKDHKYDVGENMAVTIKTNFCYGSASYMMALISYKGIEILPYSYHVRYYYADMSDIVRCTRMYNLSNNCWENAFEFISDISNLAIKNEKLFLRTWVVDEIRTMLSGLEKIASDPIEFFKSTIDQDEVTEKLSFVRIIDNDELNRFKVYPAEMTCVFQSEKLSGALKFLDNMKSLLPILPELSEYIERIIKLNRLHLPAFKRKLKEMKKEIRMRQNAIDKLSEDSEAIRLKYQKQFKKIEDIIKKERAEGNRYSEEYVVNNYPFKLKTQAFVTAYNHLSEIEEDICEKEDDLESRQSFADSLSYDIKLIMQKAY